MTVLPTVRRQLVAAAEAQANGRAMRSGVGRWLRAGPVLTVALLAVPILIAGAALALLSHRQVSPRTGGGSGPEPVRRSLPPVAGRGVDVRVAPADRYCTSRSGATLQRCQARLGGPIRLGGAHQEWLVIFSFVAPRSTVVGGHAYYYYTAEVPGRCPNASQFGEANVNVSRGHRVLLWAAFDKACPGVGRGTISLITRRSSTSAPGVGTSKPVASFRFTVPRASPSSPKVLGYKHAPGEAAAQRAALGRSYLRRVAGEKVDPELVKAFGVLRQARPHPANGLSVSAVAGAIAGLADLGSAYGANPAQAGETVVGPGKDDVWLVPGSTGACLVDRDGPQAAGSGCNDAGAVEDGKLWTLDTIQYGTGGARTKVLLGSAPDGNASVTVSWSDAATTVAPVTDNIYSVPIGSHTGWKSVTLKNSAGAVVTVPGIPHLP
jgi:hypothetical protein